MRVIGLDLGKNTVKAVELETGFRGRFQIIDYHERRVPKNSDSATVAKELLASLPKTPDRVAMTIPMTQTTFRNITVPSRDKKVLESAINFELEDELPFGTKKSYFDYAILNQSRKETHLHIAATLRGYVENNIQIHNQNQLDPDVMTTPVWAYRTLLNQSVPLESQQEPVMIIDIGDQNTVLQVQWKGNPIVTNEFNWGGAHLTEAISKKYGITLEDAEKAKIDNGFVMTSVQIQNATQDQIEFSDTVKSELNHLLTEIKQMNLTCRTITNLPISKIFLSGGTSLLPGIRPFIDEELQIIVQPLQPLKSISQSEINYSDHTEASFGLAAGLALVFANQGKSGLINFRKDEYSKAARSVDFNLRNLKKPLTLTGVFLGFLFCSLTLQSYYYQSEIEKVNDGLYTNIRSFFAGQINRNGAEGYIEDPLRLKKNVERKLREQRELVKLYGESPYSPLAFLSELSKQIGKSTTVDLIQFQVGSAPDQSYNVDALGSAELTFIAPDQTTVDRLKKTLADNFGNLKQQDIQVITEDPQAETKEYPGKLGPNGSRMKVTFGGQPRESAYGK